ncbi:MAG: helix-turn-helix transcriptional regulator [Bacteroides sp.]|nr:helix-turn-helix transcriptional regulator [Bacillota bacterium]MCM1455203.1 helix-turn-helix transcriptional regulator [Bacteroides sp.]
MDILKRIKQLQNERNWTNYQLSAETGISQSTINNMYSRNTLPSMTSLIALCKAFEISLSEFFYESDTNIILSDNEQSLILSYRKLNGRNKNIVTTLIKELNK